MKSVFAYLIILLALFCSSLCTLSWQQQLGNHHESQSTLHLPDLSPLQANFERCPLQTTFMANLFHTDPWRFGTQKPKKANSFQEAVQNVFNREYSDKILLGTGNEKKVHESQNSQEKESHPLSKTPNPFSQIRISKKKEEITNIRDSTSSNDHFMAQFKEKEDDTDVVKLAKRWSRSYFEDPAKFQSISLTSLTSVLEAKQFSPIIAECSITEVPYVRQNQSQDIELSDEVRDLKINYFVKRYIAGGLQRQKKGTILAIQGGPGAPGIALESFAIALVNNLGQEYDIYVPDFRGTGRSSQLFCEELLSQARVEDYIRCQEHLETIYGDSLVGWSVNEASFDIIQLIKFIRELHQQNHEIYIYGVSFGSYIAHRVSQLLKEYNQENLVQGILMDGICISRTCRITEWDLNFDAVGRDFLSKCNNDSYCGTKFSDPPQEALESYYRQMDSGTLCPQLYSRDSNAITFKFLFSTWLQSHDSRYLILPIVYRSLRCSPSDISSIQSIFYNLDATLRNIALQTSETRQMVSEGFSDVINRHIILSEMKDRDARYSLDQFRNFLADHSASLFGTGASLSYVAINSAGWNKYPMPSLATQFVANYQAPMILMSSDLDPQTPHFQFAVPAAENLLQNNNTLVGEDVLLFQNMPHALIANSPIQGTDRSYYENHCAFRMVVSFVKQQGQSVDQSCLQQLVGLEYQYGTPAVQQFLVGGRQRRDLFEDPIQRVDEPLEPSQASLTGHCSLLLTLLIGFILIILLTKH